MARERVDRIVRSITRTQAIGLLVCCAGIVWAQQAQQAAARRRMAASPAASADTVVGMRVV